MDWGFAIQKSRRKYHDRPLRCFVATVVQRLEAGHVGGRECSGIWGVLDPEEREHISLIVKNNTFELF